MPAPFTPYTTREIKRAIALKNDGLTWAEVSERMDRPAGSLMVTVSLHRRGLHRQGRQAASSLAINEVLTHAVTVEGVTSLKVLSRRIHRSVGTTSSRLIALGLDSRSRRFTAHATRLKSASSSEARP